MSNGPSREPESTNGEKRRRIWLTASLTLGAIAALGIVGAVWWAWVFVHERLAIWASEEFTETFDRPVKVGDVERASLTGVRFGPSEMPATENDPDELFVDSIEIRFNPLNLLRREINPQITFTNAQFYIEQNAQGEWVDITFDLEEEEEEEDTDDEPLIRVNPVFNLTNSEVVLQPFPEEGQTAETFTISDINAEVGLVSAEAQDPRGVDETFIDIQEIALDISARPQDSGNLEVSGTLQRFDYDEDASESALDSLAAQLAIQAQNLDLGTLEPIVQSSLPNRLPISINQGVLSGNVEVVSMPFEDPEITGTARLRDGAIALEALATPFTNINTRARFQGNRVILENTTADYGELSARARGTIDARNGYDLTGAIAPVALAGIANTFGFEFPFEVEGTLQAEDVQMTGPLNAPVVTGQVSSTDTVTLDQVEFADLSSQVTYSPEGVELSNLRAEPLAGGQLVGDGMLAFGDPPELSLNLEGRNLPADAIAQAYGVAEGIAIGPVSLDADISGPLNALNGVVSWNAPEGTYPTRGTAEIAANTVRIRNADIAGGTLSGVASLNQGQWTADVTAQGLQLGVFNESLAGITGGGDVQLAGSTNNFSLAAIRGTGDITASLRQGGTLDSQFTLANGTWDADIQTQNFPVQRFAPDVPIDSLSGTAQLAGNVEDFGLAAIRGTGDVTAAIAGGTVNSQFTLRNGNWNATIQAQNLPVQQFAPDAPVDQLSGTAQLAGNVQDFSLSALRGGGTIFAAIAGGTVTSDFTLANGAFQANGRGENLQLQQITGQLRGTGSTTFQLAGNLNDLTPTGIRGRANIQITEGLAAAAAINPTLARAVAPLDVSLAWDGRQLQIERLETDGLFASGTLTPQLTGPGAPGIAAIDLNISADNYDLAALPLALPPVVSLGGEIVDFQGRLTGSQNNFNFVGDLAVVNLALNDLVFDELLRGDITYSTQTGLEVALLGEEDQILVDFVPQTRQLDASIQAGEAIAFAETEGDILTARLYNFPISVLNIPPAQAPYGSLRGQVEFAAASINLDTFNTVGQIDVINLGLGFYSVDRLFGGFTYADGVARVDNGQILMADRNARGEVLATRTYDFSGRYSTTQEPQLIATLSTEEGQLRDVLEVLKIQELADFRRGFTPNEGFIPGSQEEAEAILATNPVGNPNDTLLNQLRRLSEIIELQILAEERTESATLPPLDELQGEFSGEVYLTASLPEDLQVSFDLDGEAWQWGPNIGADIVTAQGGYQNGTVTFAPLRFSSEVDDEIAFLDLSGSFSIDSEATEEGEMALVASNVPISQIKDIIDLPFDLGGRLYLEALLAGRLANPILSSDLQVVDGTLNDTPVEEAIASLNYRNSRAALDARLLLMDSDDPLTVSAQVPYRLPFVQVEPPDQTYSIRANVEDEGLALLNLFTQQIAWESGEGAAILNLEGDLQAGTIPSTFEGLILLNGATISARALPAPMTNVTGQIRLTPIALSIVVDELTGEFSDGNLVARGTFPLLIPLEQLADINDVNPETDEAMPDADGGVPETGEAAPDEAAEEATPDLPRPNNEGIRYDPLTLSLNNIDLDISGLYDGEVNGDLVLEGSLILGPRLSGEIDLTNGVITIPEGNAATAAAPVNTTDPRDSPLGPFSFENLRIVLERNINIVSGNFLNVAARGGVRLDGTLNTLRPVGTIELPSGRVGLFAASLRLAGDNDRAEFRGNFDPILDVTLQTAVSDASSFASGISVSDSPFPRNEISDNTLRSIGLTQQGNTLVRINARYRGPASELANLTTDSRFLELSSSPPRSNTEIITLLSGNVIGALDTLSGEDALAGIGTFVGSALLNNVRDFLGDTIPISEARLFQVNEGTGGVNSGADIGGEIGFEVSPSISVSVLKVLTDSSPFQFNTRYRLSDEFTLRGTTSYEDFNNRTGVLLEYETRF